MAVNALLALFAVAAGAEASAAERAQLGVTATVVRPVEIVSAAGAEDGTVAIVRNAESVELLVVGGTIDHSDEHTAVVSSAATDSLFVTLVY